MNKRKIEKIRKGRICASKVEQSTLKNSRKILDEINYVYKLNDVKG
jgi:hypothetical protein